MALTPYFNDPHERSPYFFKRHAIQNCLYGVDIDPGAVEIAKLRLWLSLVVDEEDVKQIKPLPNLDYKIVTGNSLLGVEKNLFNADLFEKLENLKPSFFDETDRKQKASLKKTIDELIHQLTNRKETFDFGIYFSEVFHNNRGFDIVIANPPYDVLNVTEGHKIDKDILVQIRDMDVYKKALGGKLNLFRLFIAKAFEVLGDDSCVTYIIPYGFMCDSSSKNIREFIMKEKQLVFIEAFPERDDPNKRLFESAKISTCIFLARNSRGAGTFRVRTHSARHVSNDVPTIYLNFDSVKQLDEINLSIPLMDESELAIAKKVNSRDTLRVKDVGRCYEGEINLTFHKKYLRDKRDGNARMIKGAAVQRYLIKEKMSQGEVQFLDQKAFLKAYNGPKTEHHSLKRIVMQGMTGVNEQIRLKMTILDEDAFCANSVNYILLNSTSIAYEYLLAFLNSKLLNWYFKLFSTNSNVNGYEVDNLPIRIGSDSDSANIVTIVNEIITSKKRDPDSDTTALEREIDQLVYKLYGLTEEEIKIVEGK
jgi:Alw26I/Eco31I/Esp3I family type II restriction m6 adenine DNA methyltransferase